MSEFNNNNNPLGLDDQNVSLISQLCDSQCDLSNAMAEYVLSVREKEYSFYVENKNISFTLSKIDVVKKYLEDKDIEKCKMLMQWVVAIIFSHEKTFQTHQDTFQMLYTWLVDGSMIFREIATTSDFPFATLLESVLKHLLAHLYITRSKKDSEKDSEKGVDLDAGFTNLNLNDSSTTLGPLRNLFRDFCNYADEKIATVQFNNFGLIIKNARNSLSHYDPAKGYLELPRHEKAEFFVLTTFIYAATTLSIERSRREGRRIIFACLAKVNDADNFIVFSDKGLFESLDFKKEHIDNKYARCLVLKNALPDRNKCYNYPLRVEFSNRVVLNREIDICCGSFLEEPIEIVIDDISQNGTCEGNRQPNEEKKESEILEQPFNKKEKKGLTIDEKKKKAAAASYETRKRFQRGIVIQSVLFSILFCFVTWCLWPLATPKDWLRWIFHYAAFLGGAVALFYFSRPKDRGLFVDVDDNGAVSIPGVPKMSFGQWFLTFCAWLFPLGLVVWIKFFAFNDTTLVKHFFHCCFFVFCWLWGMGAVLPSLLNGIARWRGFYYAPQWRFELPCTNATIGIRENYDWYDKAKSYFLGFVGGRIVESFQWFSRTMIICLVMLVIWFFFINKYVPHIYEKEFGNIVITEEHSEEKSVGEYYTKFELTHKDIYMHVGDRVDMFKFISYAPEKVKETFKWTTTPNGIIRLDNKGIEALEIGETILTLTTEHSGFTGKVKVYVKAKKAKKEGGANSGKVEESDQRGKNGRSTQNNDGNSMPDYYTSLRFTKERIDCKVGDKIDLMRFSGNKTFKSKRKN